MINEHIDLTLENNTNISLFNGISGIPIFYYLNYRLTNNKEYINKIHFLLDKIIGIINETDIQLSYCNGILGIAHMFDFIRKKNILKPDASIDIEDALSFIDEYIANSILSITRTIEDIDYLHGSFGAALYLIDRYTNDSKLEFKNKVIELFEKLALIILSEIEKTKSVINNVDLDDDSHKTNCGLAHGHISYIIILSKFIDKIPENNLIKSTVVECVDCVLGFESNDENDFSKYPSIAVNKASAHYSVALGWCYGDQTISFGLYKASIVLEDEKLKQKALDLAYRNLERNTIEKIFPTKKYDASFCHGLSSVAYIHKKWFLISNDKMFYKEYVKYINEVLNFGNQEIGIAGYQKLLGKGEYADSFGFLDGVIGIGIVLMDYLLEFDDCGWDNFLLLDVNE